MAAVFDTSAAGGPRDREAAAVLTALRCGSMAFTMPDDRDEQPRTPPRLSYTTRVHLKRRLRAIDYKFIAAIVALVLLTLLIIRYVR